ncbi:hypothetical protein E2C01_048307 [Portunus trituberculatus]|uniref:Uncharacterized protein n=1 Tax=Portunus trituberculatus TaxID=210409 RepID=A0A5B7G618_PORTR|nr:hypothetical protein [Portunus trituberculatus]
MTVIHGVLKRSNKSRLRLLRAHLNGTAVSSAECTQQYWGIHNINARHVFPLVKPPPRHKYCDSRSQHTKSSATQEG